jgi:hypothetical protein
MGTQARVFAPLPLISVEELVPAALFSRHLERLLDLTSVRELLRHT